MAPTLTYSQLIALEPCRPSLQEAVCKIDSVQKWAARAVSAAEAREAGVPFEDILWAAAALARTDKDVKRRLQLWMADCAAHVLSFFESLRSSDARPRNAIHTARALAQGVTNTAAEAAAEAAARTAARTAALASARTAAWDAALASARTAARTAAWDAARTATWDAAWAAALASARDAAEAAAWSAARAADWAAVEAAAKAAAWAANWDATEAADWAAALASARDAAEAAAWGAARAAARNAAEAAEEAWQFDRLIEWLSDPEPDEWPLPARAQDI